MLGIGVYGGIVMAHVIWSLSRPSVILSMILLMFALDQWGSALASGYLPTEAFTNYLVAALTALSIFVLYMFGKPHRFLSGPAFWLVIALYVYAFISMSWVTVPAQAMDLWSSSLPYLIVFLCGAPLLVQSIDDIEEPLKAFLLLGIPLIFCMNFFLEWGYRGFVVDGEVTRLPLALAQFGGYLMITAALFTPRQSDRRAYWILIRLAAFALGALLIIKTGARGQFISATLCSAVIFGLGRANFSIPKLILSSVIASFLVATAYFGAISYMKSDPALQATAGRWSIDRLFEDYGERSIRVLRIEAMLKEWGSSPGKMLIGLGNSASYDPGITGCAGGKGCYPHNLPVEILTEEGLVGFTIYASLLLYICFVAVRAISDPTIDPERKPALKVLLAFVIFEAILSLKQGSLLGNWGFCLFAILLDRCIDLLRRPVVVLDGTEKTQLVEQHTREWLARRQPNGGFGRRSAL
jgi:hypothetical protein